MANSYRWAAAGDINAFFGLTLDNIAGMVLAVSLLQEVFGFPAEFALRYMIPGTALGVLIGDLWYFGLALSLAKRTGKPVTAMPLGLDTPSTIGSVLFVLGPAFAHSRQAGLAEHDAALHAWHVGIAALILTGVIKLFLAFLADWARRTIPRAGLLGSLSAVALVLIAFLPLLDLFAMPIIGLASLAVILVTLVARMPLPGKIPGAAGAVLISVALYYGWLGLSRSLGDSAAAPVAEFVAASSGWPHEWLSVFSCAWLKTIPEALAYLPYVVPFALTTVIGGIDCTESAASAGDEYRTHTIVGVEAVATIAAGLCGGVIQTTPYIGHPAYKAMGARALYTLLTALFVGGAGLIGYFSSIYLWIPKAALLPILVFIGLEITAQSFHATPARHYPALAFACLPALAKVVAILVSVVLFDPALLGAGMGLAQLRPKGAEQIQVVMTLAGGFVVTSLLWGAALAEIIDRRLVRGAGYFLVCSGATLFGMMHAADDKMYLPWTLDSATLQKVLHWAGAYLVMAGICLAMAWWQPRHRPTDLAAEPPVGDGEAR